VPVLESYETFTIGSATSSPTGIPWAVIPNVLAEIDGPLLQHGLQGFLAERYALFRRAS